MRRIVLGLALGFGMLLAAATSVSAHTYCTVDPAVGVGSPVHATATVGGSSVYVTGDSSSTDVGATVGI
jgi:hypothetical protein